MRKQIYWFIKILEGYLVPEREITAIFDSFEAGDWLGTKFDELIMQSMRLGWDVPEDMIEEAKALLEELRT